MLSSLQRVIGAHDRLGHAPAAGLVTGASSGTRLELTRLPGDFHHRAGMDDTAFGCGASKNSRVEVARQGYEALLAGVPPSWRATGRTALAHRALPETFEAARHATEARLR